MKKRVVSRRDFVRYLHTNGGLSYLKAEQACTAFFRFLESNIAAHSTIRLGRVGSLRPKALKERRVVMGCVRAGGQDGGAMRKVKQEFWLGQRTRFVFRLNERFGHHHELVP